jgi:hypothetical protein
VLSNKTVGFTKRDKTHINTFTVYDLKNDRLEFVNIFSANKVFILYSVDLLCYVGSNTFL